MRSVWPLSLSLLEIIALYLQSIYYRIFLVSFEIFASLNGTCRCIWMALGIKIEDCSTEFGSLVGSHWWWQKFLVCIHCVSNWSESMSYVTSLAINGSKGSSMLLSGFISPRCLCLGKTISSGLVLIIVLNNLDCNFSPKIWVPVQQ